MKQYYEDFALGERATSSGRVLTEEDVRRFIVCTGNDHPIHTDRTYCERNPLVSGCVVQGTLVLGVADGLMAQETLPSDCSIIHYGSNGVRFLRPVYPGDTIHIETETIFKRIKNPSFGLITFSVCVRNQRGEPVVIYEDIQMIERKSP